MNVLRTILDEDAPLVHKKNRKEFAPLSKKERKAKKLEILQSKRNHGAKSSLETIEKARAGNSLTPAWSQQMSEVKREALPVIKEGRVVRILVDAHESDLGDESARDEDVLDEFKVSRMRKGKAKRDAIAALRRKKTENNNDGIVGNRGNDDDKMAHSSDEEQGYDFRPEFKSKMEAMADYGVLDEEFQNDAMVVTNKKRRRIRDQSDSEDSDDSDVEGIGNSHKQANLKGDADLTKEESEPEETLSGNALLRHKRMLGLAKMSTQRLKAHIASISRRILASPEEALKRSIKKPDGRDKNDEFDDDDGEEENYKMTDLFDILTANSPKAKTTGKSEPTTRMFPSSIIECTMLSLLLIFKDICPGYKIRPPQENMSMQDVRLKKETKRLRDYEFALLGAYQRYLKFLSGCVATGLGNPRNSVQQWNSAALLGISALRCQGELLRAIPFFNFRDKLIQSITSRAAQPCAEIHNVACKALEGLFEKDKEWDASLEAIQAMSGVLSERKAKLGSLPEAFLKALWKLQLHVRAEDAKDLKKQAKKEKRKRKREGTDDVATKMLESSSEHDKLMRNKAQAQCLHEVLLLYFRILKGKIGFRLLPTALEGLSRVSHLINTDTAEDLVAVMRNLLDNPASIPPPTVRLRCLLCALRTLNGPGEALGLDMDFFTSALLQLIRELPSVFAHWDQVLECVDICIVRNREERTAPVINYVKSMFFTASSTSSPDTGVSALSMAHKILLRYPRLRARLRVFGKAQCSALQEDDDVGDLAMAALRSESGDNGKTSDAFANVGTSDDGTWILPLLRLHPEGAFAKSVAALCDREINTMPLRYDSAVYSYTSLIDRANSVFDRTPSTLRAAIARKHNIPIFGECDGVGTSSKKMKLDKRQRLMQKKLSGGSALSVLVEKELAQLFFTNSDEGQRGQRGVSFKSLYRGNGL